MMNAHIFNKNINITIIRIIDIHINTHYSNHNILMYAFK